MSILSKASLSGLPIILYVAPHDLTKTAKTLLDVLGDRTVYVARELTKIHESLTKTTLSNFECEERGEIVMIIEGATSQNPLNDLSIADHIKHYIDLGIDKKTPSKKSPKIEVFPRTRCINKPSIYNCAK